MFAAILLIIVGTVNIIYGIGALDDARLLRQQHEVVLDDLNTLGWVLIILGVVQLTGGFSLLAGNTYGRVIGIIGGSSGAQALFSIGGDNPWWSLSVFALCVWIVYGIVVFGEDEEGGPGQRRRLTGPIAVAPPAPLPRAGGGRWFWTEPLPGVPAEQFRRHGPHAGRRSDDEHPTDSGKPVAHVGEAGARRHLVPHEPGPVVAHLEVEISVHGQGHGDRRHATACFIAF